MESFKIAILCILAALLCGIVHDQITARICVEYFTSFMLRFSHSISNLARHRVGHSRDLVGRRVLCRSDDPCCQGRLSPCVARIRAGSVHFMVTRLHGGGCASVRNHRICSSASRSFGHRLVDLLSFRIGTISFYGRLVGPWCVICERLRWGYGVVRVDLSKESCYAARVMKSRAREIYGFKSRRWTTASSMPCSSRNSLR